MTQTITIPLDAFIDIFVSQLDYAARHIPLEPERVERLAQDAEYAEDICEDLLGATTEWQPEVVAAMDAAHARYTKAYKDAQEWRLKELKRKLGL